MQAIAPTLTTSEGSTGQASHSTYEPCARSKHSHARRNVLGTTARVRRPDAHRVSEQRLLDQARSDIFALRRLGMMEEALDMAIDVTSAPRRPALFWIASVLTSAGLLGVAVGLCLWQFGPKAEYGETIALVGFAVFPFGTWSFLISRRSAARRRRELNP